MNNSLDETLHTRLNNPNIVRVFVDMIKKSPNETLTILKDRLKLEASEHHQYNVLMELIENRLGT